MVLQNSYIFLYKDKTEKEKYQKIDDNSIVLNLPTSIKYYIKRTFNISNSTEILHFYEYEYETIINPNGYDF
jgi:tRNA G37 N-methylase Trm5